MNEQFKLFDKYDVSQIEIKDPALKPYINLSQKLLVKSYGRQLEKWSHAKVNILERLANLGVRSLVIEATGDRAGLLRELLLPFEKEGVSLTAIDSHKGNGDLRFEIGLDEETVDREKVARLITELSRSGFNLS